ncbi:MAG: GIY-YIG nuclease family protein [Chloroflexi bacterium]|nr:GIY-YIG nuclease family protein [Chloroflexota bacterium]
MGFYVYMVRCSDGSFYTGHTDNLEQRLAAHNAGETPGYTQTRRPVHLAFCEELPTRLDSLERERQLKGWSKAKKEALSRGDWDAIVQRLPRPVVRQSLS